MSTRNNHADLSAEGSKFSGEISEADERVLEMAHKPAAQGTTLTKIFGIGLSRTGTLSLTDALRILGYDAVHTPVSEEAVQRAGALTDSPISFRFEELDSQFLGAKFIQTIREIDSWVESCRTRFSHPPPSRYFRRIRLALYGTVMFDEQAFRESYHRFNERVDRHFLNNPQSLLKLNITESPNPWQPLCEFLNLPRPDVPFPHKNKRRTGRAEVNVPG